MSYAQTIATFFKVVGPIGGGTEWQVVSIMQGLFVPDDPKRGGPPNVGLTTGGPQFQGQANIGVLFTHLFHCFPDMVFAPANGLRLADGKTIAIEATLSTGIHPAGRPWAPSGHVSPPISNIIPSGANQVQNLPVCAVFTFDPTPNSSLIQNLALYFDRWRMAVGWTTPAGVVTYGLWDHAHPPHLA
jgi:hypothetical protein